MRSSSTSLVITAVGAVALVLAGSGCSKQEAKATPTIEEKTLAVTPPSSALRIAFLSGELADVKVVERVEQGTGTVVEPPKLRATLKLKNRSSTEAARLVAGTIEYLDAQGKVIAVGEGRGEPKLTFSSYQSDRLDPGMEISQDLDVPFPVAALKERKLSDVRLHLTYVTLPYRAESATMPITVGE